jgi:hypothetical protein
MLKTIWPVFLLLMITLNLDAQQKFVRSTLIGADASASFCRVSFDPAIAQNLLSNTSFGLVFRHVSEPHIGTQIELNYAGKGWIEDRDSIGTYKRNLQVFDMPVTAVFIAGSKKLRFAFTIGPYVSYRLHEKETIHIPDSRYYREYYLKALESNWEFGFTLGISTELYTAFGVFGARVAYCHSLTNLFPLSSDNYYYSASRGQSLNAGIVYFIEL